MGLDIDPEYGGSGFSYFTNIVVVEELAKIDPAVSACLDVHNTLAVTTINLYASQDQKRKYLQRLCTDTVSCRRFIF